ncbi:PD40 domain-containing protein, partial [Candidatus Fermentibacteria bacterium]|nr:PD40 domain-containing protein [Candidatus Fermentibacteria bacterium]
TIDHQPAWSPDGRTIAHTHGWNRAGALLGVKSLIYNLRSELSFQVSDSLGHGGVPIDGV